MLLYNVLPLYGYLETNVVRMNKSAGLSNDDQYHWTQGYFPFGFISLLFSFLSRMVVIANLGVPFGVGSWLRAKLALEIGHCI